MTNIKVAIVTVIEPFEVPGYVVARGKIKVVNPSLLGKEPTLKIDLTELDVNTLNELCDNFRRGVFARANKPIEYTEQGPRI